MLKIAYHLLVFAIGVASIVLLGVVLTGLQEPHPERVVAYVGLIWLTFCVAWLLGKLRRRVAR
ncbi:hypothetical protein WI25_01490 [Burkholderia cepacia]|uniref:hypothetical protein n=1 Tax=Burkholderia cepacia TaxID=292 RepID=UPI00075528D0|nr:hypothetical protein [Burkholderia cepacia]KUY74574.1 hypothetical protein WI25_01490 [Burkholderia cepacia]